MTAAANENFPRPKPRVLICTSPKAGSGLGREAISGLTELLASDGIAVEVTTDIQRVRELSQLAAAGSGLSPFENEGDRTELVVVAAGGDGTLALVAQKLRRVRSWCQCR